MTWTDERLEQRFDGIDRRFDEVDSRFARVEGELLELRREMRAGFGALQSVLNRAAAGIIVALLGVIAAILARSV